ncbi:phage portal protein [Parafrankia sp. EUN1f]|uniref:phage portal protein n=1 Tax=Parafrankia sp. EUN1f TaxID=102897 RepID=UPI0012F7D0A3|nr:phage portal protein [Parafrankia sp. EUN1f]
MWGDSFGASRLTASGARVTQDSALRMIAVHFCVSLIADVISTLPTEVYRLVAGGQVQIKSPIWLDEPNPEMTAVDFWHRVLVSLLLDGNAFVFIVRGPNGQPVSLIPLEPSSVQPYRYNGQISYVFAGGLPFTPDDLFPVGSQILSRNEILHISAFTRPGDLRGLSPIEVAREAIGLGLTLEDYAARFFGQGATVSGVIQSPVPMNADQAKVMARAFADHHSGGRKAHLPMILTNGSTWQQITVPNDQAQFLDSRRFSKTEIGNLYRIPGYLLDPQVSSTWGSGVEEQNRMLVDITLQPWVVRVERAFSLRLFPRGQNMRFNLDALLRGRTLDRYQAHSIGLTSQFLTVNEVRSIEDLPPLPGGDDVVKPKEPSLVLRPGKPPADEDGPPADATTEESE